MSPSTIFALSSGGLPSGVAIIRVSGPSAESVLTAIAGPTPMPRKASLRQLRHPHSLDILDRALVLWFPGPASATGEDCVEFHIHGSRAVAADLLDAIGEISDCRPAEAGEFTRRAFETGQLDLTAAEGLADLIAAQTSFQRRQALRQADGSLASLYEGWRQRLIRARALIEAELDFADEDDVPGSVSDQVWDDVASLVEDMNRHILDGRRGERLRSGVEVILLGKPNAGKSSLLNAIAKRDVAIISEEAGTTRDLIEISLDLDGVPVTLIDTAGLRDVAGGVEQEGIRRAKNRARSTDLILWLDAVDETDNASPSAAVGMDGQGQEDTEISATAEALVWRLRTKIDLPFEDCGVTTERPDWRHQISVHTGVGITELLQDLSSIARELCGGGEEVLLSRSRHRIGLERARSALSDGLALKDIPIELRAEHLRLASDELGRLTGRIDVEDLLGVIFSEFCIGK